MIKSQAMGGASEEFDRRLFGLKTRELSHQMQTKSVASDNAAFQGAPATGRTNALGGSVFVRIVDGQLSLLREWLEGIDRIAREVWQIQGELVTPDFVRDVLVQEAMLLIGARESTVKATVELTATRMRGSEDPYPAAQNRLAMEVQRLKTEVSEKYEIEVRTLEHKAARKPKPKPPEPIRPVNTSGGVRLNSMGSSDGGAMLESSDFYPAEFSSEARDRIEREKIRVYRAFLPSSVYEFKDQDLAIRCIMQIFLAFAKEACALRKEHGWTIDHVERVAKEFLRRLTIEVVFEKFPGLDRHWISNWDGSIAADVERRFKASGEWVQYEELLLAESAPKPVQAKGAIPETVAGSFTHSPDYSSVTFRGKTFSLTSRQAQFIEILHEAHRNETPDVSMHFILEKLGTQNSRWQDTWKSNPRAKRALIKPGTRKGKLRLNL